MIGHGPFENGILFLKEALFLAFPAVSVIDQRHELLSHRIDPSLYALMPQELTMVGKKPRDLAPHELSRRIDAQAIPRDYRDKQAIFTQGDKADAMFYIQNGNVKLTVASKGGKKAVIAILRQGDFFGEGCLVRQSMRVSSATTIQPSTIARVERVTIVRLIHEDPAFANFHLSFTVAD